MKSKYFAINKYLLIFISLIGFYTVSLAIVYIIPNDMIQVNYEDSMTYIQGEGDYPVQPFGGTTAARLDNFTDRVMLEGTIKDDEVNFLKASHNIREYPRYWHGYQLVLRPLLMIMNYTNIRYINMFFILLLLTLVFSDIKKRLGVLYSSSFLLSMTMIYVAILPYSMQFTTSFSVTMFAMLGVGQLVQQKKAANLNLLFFITGSFVNFVDFLTYPLITLGFPLIYAILLKNESDKEVTCKENFLFVIFSSISWGIAYALTWISKWIISSLVLAENVLKNAVEQAAFRTGGSTEVVEVSAFRAIKDNVNLMFDGPNFKLLIFLLILWIIVWLFFGKSVEVAKKYLPIVLLAIYPYVWYVVLANHSIFHSWFTYRNQAITVFALLSFLLSLIDFSKMEKKLRK